MVSYYVYSALSAQHEDEIERRAALAQRRVHGQRDAATTRLPRERRLHWRRSRRLRAV